MNQLEKTLTSLEVAEMVGRRHDQVIRDIRNIIGHLGDHKSVESYFTESTYKNVQNKVMTRFLLTKKGCELYATRMTGEKGTQFAVAYIERFNEMENQINQNKIDTSQLSQELQMFNSLFNSMAKQELENVRMNKEIKETKQEVADVRNIFTINPKSWRKEVNDLIIKISRTKNSLDAYRETRSESYQRLEDRARCDLDIRLQNMRNRMKKAGASKSAINRKNKMDVIESDTRLMEIYLTVVKEMAIKHSINSTKAVI